MRVNPTRTCCTVWDPVCLFSIKPQCLPQRSPCHLRCNPPSLCLATAHPLLFSMSPGVCSPGGNLKGRPTWGGVRDVFSTVRWDQKVREHIFYPARLTGALVHILGWCGLEAEICRWVTPRTVWKRVFCWCVRLCLSVQCVQLEPYVVCLIPGDVGNLALPKLQKNDVVPMIVIPLSFLLVHL